VYLTWTRDSSAARRRIQLVCLDAKDGQQLWCRDLGAATGRTHRKNGHASATVAAGGGRVFACDAAGRLSCFDTDGHWIWKTPGPGVSHQWGVASSPVLFGDLVIQLCDGEQQAYLAAYRQAGGQLVWRTKRESHGCWSSPVLLRHARAEGDRWEVVVNGTGSSDGSAGWMIAYDPWTGSPLWRVQGTTDIPCPTAIVGGGLVISTTGGNGPIIAVEPGGRGDVTDSRVVWQQPLGGPYVPTGVVYRQRLYVVSDGGVLSCRELEDGRMLWSQRLGGTYSASLVAGAGLLYVVSEQGDVTVVTAGDTYELVARNRFRERCVASPAIAGGLLYMRTENWLYCIEGTDSSASRGFASRGEQDALARDETTAGESGVPDTAVHSQREELSPANVVQ
jgi:outer membrane protein assembly factor BamB